MNEFTRGWKVVLTCMLGIALCGPNILLYSIGALAPELSQEFGWSHGAIQLGSLISVCAIVVCLPIAAYLSDRFGVRRVAVISIGLSSFFIMLLTFVQDNIAQYYVLTLLASVAFGGVLPLTWTKMVTSWFDKRLGLALGLTLLGTGLGGALIKPATAGMIAAFGWRGAYIGLAIIPLVFVLPLVLMWFKDPDVKITTSLGSDENKSAASTGISFKQILKDWRFWVIAIAYVPIGFAVSGLITNMEVILASGGADAATVVTAATAFGLFVIVGRVIGGLLLDKYNAGIIGGTLIMSLSIAFLLLMQQDLSLTMALVALAFAGFGTGVEFDVLAYMVKRIFGPVNYSKVFGSIIALMYFASAFGPVLFGLTYDKHGSFGSILIPVAVSVFVASLMIGSLSGSLKVKTTSGT